MDCLIIGIDALDLRLLHKHLEKLPTFMRLIRGGASGELESIEPTLSPVIWTTLATGKTRNKHGIKDFVDESRHLITSTMRKEPAFWNITSHYGLKTCVIGWWNTNPVEAINGIMISDKNNLKLKQAFHPASVEGNAIRVTTGKPMRDLFGEELFREHETMFIENKWIDNLYITDLENHLNLLKLSKDMDIAALYFRFLDILTHFFLGYEGLEIGYWRYLKILDNYLMEMLNALNPELVLVISDHGGERLENPKLLIHESVDLNLFLYKIGLTLYPNKEGSIVYALPQHKNSGRKLAYDPEKHTFNELKELLSKFETTDGTKVFINCYDTGRGRMSVVFNARTLNKKIKTRDGIIKVSDYLKGNYMSGDHRKEGTIIACGKKIKKGYKIIGMGVLDFLPTLLYYLKLPIEGRMDGKVYQEMFTESHPKEKVKRYGFWHRIQMSKEELLDIKI